MACLLVKRGRLGLWGIKSRGPTAMPRIRSIISQRADLESLSWKPALTMPENHEISGFGTAVLWKSDQPKFAAHSNLQTPQVEKASHMAPCGDRCITRPARTQAQQSSWAESVVNVIPKPSGALQRTNLALTKPTVASWDAEIALLLAALPLGSCGDLTWPSRIWKIWWVKTVKTCFCHLIFLLGKSAPGSASLSIHGVTRTGPCDPELDLGV